MTPESSRRQPGLGALAPLGTPPHRTPSIPQVAPRHREAASKLSAPLLLRDGYCLHSPAVQWLGPWAVVGMSTSCLDKLDLLGMRKGQVSSGPSSRPALIHKTNQAPVKREGMVLRRPQGAPFTQILLGPFWWPGHRDSGSTG